MRKEWTLLWFFWVLGVSGCSIAPKVSDHGGIDLDSSFIFSEHDWVFRGRLAVKNNGVAESVRIKWQHDSGGERLVLYGPLGRQLVVVLLMGESIVVDYGAGNKITQQDIAQGVDFGLGFEVPILAFRYWVLGLPAPNQQFVDTPEGFKQQGWHVLISKMNKVEMYNLPKKIQFSHEAVRLKLLVDQWQLR